MFTRHNHQPAFWLAHKGTWDKLSPADQSAIVKALPATVQVRARIAGDEVSKMAFHKSKGGFVYELTDAQRAEWAKVVVPGQKSLGREIRWSVQGVVRLDPEGQKGVRRSEELILGASMQTLAGKFLDALYFVEKWVAIAAFAVITVLLFADVLGRESSAAASSGPSVSPSTPPPLPASLGFAICTAKGGYLRPSSFDKLFPTV